MGGKVSSWFMILDAMSRSWNSHLISSYHILGSFVVSHLGSICKWTKCQRFQIFVVFKNDAFKVILQLHQLPPRHIYEDYFFIVSTFKVFVIDYFCDTFFFYWTAIRLYKFFLCFRYHITKFKKLDYFIVEYFLVDLW